ncbi:hypothetical protein CDV36_006142 [Fusarium kuroshium]|uniref:Heterokaryon incompatibility domain-containing protein n=1 Tax=Fusarium kuroshium TaxID=2010991 RepID=A0A3M2S9E0_9HYPO|nr:hypothetical protein CDV36_006142 [Fusarium kuroshium]
MTQPDQLCHKCKELFTQPDLEPSCWQDPSLAGWKRQGRDILETADSGCPLCRIVWNEVSSKLGSRINVEEAVIGPRICWDDDTGAFCALVYKLQTTSHVYPEILSVDMYLKTGKFIHWIPSWKCLTMDTAVGDMLPDCPRPPNSVDACQSMATRWLFECVTQHEKCRPSSKQSWLPTRLIDVGPAWSAQDPKVVMASSLSSSSPSPLYISLSHRWTTDNMLKLKKANINDFMQRIRPADLPFTFHDAIRLCRNLGIRYIWIDSLCIIQDSKKDWLKESSNMGKVYEYSFCNIAATSASSGQGGLYSWRDSHLITPHTTRINWKGHESEYVFFLDSHWFKSISRAPLNGRGWVFQERLLSPRTLHFSSQLFWECRTLKACETYPCGLPSEPSILGDDVDQTFPGSTKDWRDGLEKDGVGYWELLMQMFCRCYLTKESDRLAAIAGIASQAQPLLNDEYLAGLWKSQLPHGLVWKLENMVGQDDLIVTRPTNYRGPSWSWASLDFEAANINILDREGIDRQLVKIIEVKIESSTDQIYTNVTGGYIRVLGKLGKVNLPDHDDAEWRVSAFGLVLLD